MVLSFNMQDQKADVYRAYFDEILDTRLTVLVIRAHFVIALA